MLFKLNYLHIISNQFCIRLKESNQLKAVINHPAFQSDPFGAIHQHLQRTQPVPDEKPKSKDKKSGKSKKIIMRRKKSGGQQSMDI